MNTIVSESTLSVLGLNFRLLWKKTGIITTSGSFYADALVIMKVREVVPMYYKRIYCTNEGWGNGQRVNMQMVCQNCEKMTIAHWLGWHSQNLPGMEFKRNTLVMILHKKFGLTPDNRI